MGPNSADEYGPCGVFLPGTRLPMALIVVVVFGALSGVSVRATPRGAVVMAAPPIGAPVAEVLAARRQAVDAAMERTRDLRSPEEDEVWALPYLVDSDGDVDEAVGKMEGTIAWARGEGKPIADAAREAVAAATASGAWDNEAVVSRAPHAAAVRPYIGADQIQTIPSASGDYLIYTIRAAAIDDEALMEAVGVSELAEFFLYAKEVNARVARDRMRASGRYVAVVTANDLSNARLLGASDFRKALSLASKKSTELHPGLAGPTLLLNLPPLLGALVKLFTPLFPKAVLDRLRFENGPLRGVSSLSCLLSASQSGDRQAFLADIDATIGAMGAQ